MSIFCFGLSHQTAVIDVRERFAIPESALPEALTRLKRMPGLTEGLRSSTAITRGSVSVASVSVDLAEQIFGDLKRCKVMILGAGETGEKTAKAFRSRGAEHIFVSNRSFERAKALAITTGGRAIHFEVWEQEVRHRQIAGGKMRTNSEHKRQLATCER